jgi:hypothetical protein
MTLNVNVFLNSAPTLSLVENTNCSVMYCECFTSRSIFESIILLFVDQKDEITSSNGLGVVKGITQIAVVQQFACTETAMLEGQEDKGNYEPRIAQELSS